MTTHKYDDVINMEYPFKDRDLSKHPGMSTADRAKIFAPFAALKCFEDAIDTKQQQNNVDKG